MIALPLLVLLYISLLVVVQSFGPFGPNCNSQFSSEACHGKGSKCTWCNSTDGDDHLCFSIKTAQKLNSSSWICSSSTYLAEEIPVPQNSYFSLYQESDSKHCVELLCDVEKTHNDSCFQTYWADHGYQYSSYDAGMCPENYNFVNLEDIICNSSASSPNASGSPRYGCSIFTLGIQD